jgi:phosphohistidine phosphatase
MERRDAMTRRLILMRHCQAHPLQPQQEDFTRTLTERGGHDAQVMGRLLMRRGWVPDGIVASPAERTSATARIVATACGFDVPRIAWVPELYLADAEQYWQTVESQDAALCCVLICGHNPGLSRLASRLGKPAKRRELPTAGLVTGVWQAAGWRGLELGMAQDCEPAGPQD